MLIIQSHGYKRIRCHAQDGTAEFGQALQGLGGAVTSFKDILQSLTSFFQNFDKQYPQWKNQYGQGISFKRILDGNPAQAPVILQDIINSPYIDQKTKDTAQVILNEIQPSPVKPPSLSV